MYENDGKFNRKAFERDQLPHLIAIAEGKEFVTHCANKTITIHPDGTYKVSGRDGAKHVEVRPVDDKKQLKA